MKLVLNKKEYLILSAHKRVDIKGKATQKQLFWKLDKVNKFGEIMPCFEVNNENFSVICNDVLNMKEKLINKELKAADLSINEYGNALINNLKLAKASIKIINDIYYVVDSNDEIIFKTKNFFEINSDLKYKNTAKDLSAEIDVCF